MRKRSTLKAIFLLLIATGVGAFLWLQVPRAGNEILFVNGQFLTLDANIPTADAMLVRAGKIVAIGAEKSVRAQASDAVDLVDLDGNTLMPGLIEPHTHPLASAMAGAAIDVSGFKHRNREHVVSSLLAGIENGGNGGWITAFGWDPVMLPDLVSPTLAELDEWSPDKPLIILTQMMHDAFANSAALRAAGIDASTANPPGGEFVRDSAGQLTGTVRELGAISRLLEALPTPPRGAPSLLLAQQYKQYARAGYTTLGVLGPVARTKDPIASIQQLAGRVGTPVRTRIYALPDQLSDDAQPQFEIDNGAITGVKFWMDGSPFAGGAAFAQPYENSSLVLKRLHLDRNHMGTTNATGFAARFAHFHQRGFQIAVHAQGERAIEQVLDAVESALASHPRRDHRHRLEHNALINKAQLARAAQLGVTVSFFIDHLYFYGHVLDQLVGDRIERYMPIKSALQAGHRVSAHADHPASPINALRVMQTLRQRVARTGNQVMAAEQRLSAHEALAAMTIDAAWQLRLEKTTGSLTPGKSADLLILSGNPLATDAADLQSLRVVQTWLQGQPTDTRTINLPVLRLGFSVVKAMLLGD